MKQPTKLLQNFGMYWILRNNALVGFPSTNVIALLLIYVPNLEPNVGIGKRTWRIAQDAIEAPQAFVIFGLLLVDDPQPEEDLIGLVKVLVHLQD
jgi:hypothetical protein